MAAEAASSGPRYAPEDPTLPQPWKGLIDGNTGLMYYWNPETNVTQYEKPAELPPPLPPGMPAAASHPTMAPIPAARTTQNSDVQSHQVMQAQQQQSQPQQSNSGSQQQMLGMPQGAQQNSLHGGPNGQQHGSLTGTSVQQPGHPMSQQLRPQMQYPGQQMPLQHDSQIPQQGMQPMHPMAHHFGQQNQMYQFGPVGNPQGYQFPHQQTQYMPLQPNMPPQGQQNSQPQSHQIFQGQQYPHPQEQKVGINQRDDTDPQWGKQVGFSPTHKQQSGSSSVQNPSNHGQISSIQPSQSTHFSGPPVVMQQPTSFSPVQQSGVELVHQQHGPRFQSQAGPGSLPDQQQKVSAFKPNMGYEGSPLGRASNDYYHKSNQDGNAMVPQQPKLAAIPMGRNVQEMRRGDLPPKNTMPNIPGVHTTSSVPPIHDMYGHPTGGPQYANNASARPQPAIMGSLGPNSMHGSDAEIYCQTHEVTAKGENVPPPFMTFEATGFPPEILREVRYLLHRGSTCRTLPCISFYLRNKYF